MTEDCFATDEAEDVAGSVRQALRMFEFVEKDPQAWKWIALALHSAVQGACVCHLTTSAAPIGAVTEKNAGKWLEYHEKRRTDPSASPPNTYLMALPGLLKAVRQPYSAGDGSNPEGITLSDSELEWFGRFHTQIRNQFTHFEPMSWVIEVSGIPELGVVTARIIGEVLEYGYGFRHLETDLRDELKNSIRRLSLISSLRA